MAKLTPMMKQYMEIKEKYKEHILFFRLGDFYEMFFEDALKASRELEIALTGRDCGLEERAPMCGVPYHSADSYIARLIEKGYKVAICEQIEDPSKAKGIVKRDVIRVISPGTVIDPEMLNDELNNYILTIIEDEKGIGIAYCDITTGELNTTQFSGENKYKVLYDEILKINPKEILISNENDYSKKLINDLRKIDNILITEFPRGGFTYKKSVEIIKNHFNIFSLDSIGLSDKRLCIMAIGGILDYVKETQRVSLIHINNINLYSHNQYMLLDKYTRRNLELVETLMGNKKKGSLLWVLDKTCTSMGARTLRKWIEEPLTNVKQINERLDSVEVFYNDIILRDELKELLKKIYDLERLSSKLVYGNINARDLICLKTSIGVLPDIKKKIENVKKGQLNHVYEKIDTLEDVFELLDKSIEKDPPLSIKEGGIIKSSYNSELQRLREIIKNGKQWIIDLEAKERERTGIKSLKIGFNKVFGYYIEITKSNIKNAPEDYIRKQTLANSERYIMPELKEIESSLLGAEEKIADLEYRLFVEIREEILKNVDRILKTAKAIAQLDALLSFAEVSYSQGYIKPTVNSSKSIILKESRHPVVEKVSRDELFVPNDTLLDDEENIFYIITGPNMAGKSTYLRQVALNVLMAQIGCFVPASEAIIGVVDRIFTRVGASDNLAQGQSTFMVEMSELSNILHNATANSLIILDEIGRGTSTYDGLSIAWAVVEYISDRRILGAKTLFATHYHELTELEGKIRGVKNYCISVKEVGEDIVFLRKIIRGGADKSYGIQVAKLAGLPEKVVERSKELLSKLEESDINKERDEIACDSSLTINETTELTKQLNFFENEYNHVIDELRKIEVINLTPIEALNKLYEIVKKVKTL